MSRARREFTTVRLERARQLRANPSVSEAIAWKYLRKEQLGFKFRRQHLIGSYILDFFCPEASLAVEFDGEQHCQKRDEKRDAFLLSLGITTFRVPNREFFQLDGNSTDWLLEIKKECERKTGRAGFPHPLPPPQFSN